MSAVRRRIAGAVALAVLGTACGGGDRSLSDLDRVTPAAPDADQGTVSEEPADPAPADAPGPSTPEPVGELLVWADRTRTAVLQQIVPSFERTTGIDVTLELVDYDEMRERVVGAAVIGQEPDVFVGAHAWTADLADAGIIAPIDLGATADELLDVAVEAFGHDGRTWALPHLVEAVALYRNTDLVPQAPTTFDGIGAACEDLDTEACLVVGGAGATPDAYYNYPFLSSFGATIFAYDATTGTYDPSEVRLDGAEARLGAEHLAEQVRSGVVASTDYDEAEALFSAGRAAFWITGPWELPDLSVNGPPVSVSTIPQIGDAPVSALVAAQGFFVTADTDDQEFARAFLLDAVATDGTMRSLYTVDRRGTAWLQLRDTLGPDTRALHDAAADGVPIPSIPEMDAVWGPLGDNLLLLRNGQLGPATALERIGAEVRAGIGQ